MPVPNPPLLLSIWLPLWPPRTRVTPTCPSPFVRLSSELSAVGPNHTTICPVPGSCPPRHGSSKCYSSVNLRRTTGTPALWHTPVLSLRREEGTSEGKLYCKKDFPPWESWRLQREQDVRSEGSIHLLEKHREHVLGLRRPFIPTSRLSVQPVSQSFTHGRRFCLIVWILFVLCSTLCLSYCCCRDLYRSL